MSRLSGKINWTGDNDVPKPKEATKVEKNEMTPAKKEKAMESIIKKLDGLKTECDNLYKHNPTSELSSAMSLLNSFQFNIDKLKKRN